MPHTHQYILTLARLSVLVAIFSFASLLIGQQSHAAQPKVDVCHIPPGNPTNTQIISVGPNAAAQHIELHGDFLLESAVERCDAIDNTCDGFIDEGFNLGAFCEQGQGACYATGSTICAPDQVSLPVCNADIIPAPGLNCDLGATYDGDCNGTPDIAQEACTGVALIEICGDPGLYGLKYKIAIADFYDRYEAIAIQAQNPLIDNILQSPVCQTYGVTPPDGNPDNTCASDLLAALNALEDDEILEQLAAAEENLNTDTSNITQDFTEFLASNTTKLNEKIGSFGSAGDSSSLVAAIRDIFNALLVIPTSLYVSETAQNALESCHTDYQNQLVGVDQCLASCQAGDFSCRGGCKNSLGLIVGEYRTCLSSLLSQTCTSTQ